MRKRRDTAAAIRARLSRHWVARLRREKVIEALEHAVTLGVLERVDHPGLSLFRGGRKIVGWTLARVHMLIRQAFGARSPGAPHDIHPRATSSASEWEFCADEEVVGDDVWEVPLFEGGGLRKVDGGKGAHLGSETRQMKASAAAAPAESSTGDLVTEELPGSEKAASTAAPAEAGGPGAAVSPAPSGPEAAATGSGKESARQKRRQPIDRMALLRLVRSQAAPPSATHVATLLLLADAVARAGQDLSEVFAILRRPKPIIAITGTVPGFEAAFVDLLKSGFVLPGSTSFMNGYELRSINDYRRADGTSRTIVLFRGREIDDDSELVSRQVSLAIQNPYPILTVAEEADHLPATLLDAADLNLLCNPVTVGLIAQTMQVVLGEPARLPAVGAHPSILEGCELLGIADLGLAIRPGMSPERSIALLRRLIERARQARDAKAAAASRTGKAASSSRLPVNSRRGKIGTGSTIIDPEPTDPASTAGKPPLLVETLSGYGEASNWAMALKGDLELWEAGRLEWSEMSTRLLLAGPPGTGKTTFARALANTLQLKLLVTSVGTWLEPSHLGDVLARMAAAFAEAEANAPCILFIDEIDGIGRRGTGNRDYDDYWISVVNRALELLDGAAKSQGVIIVGATNHPQVIDKALLRSGRLETRIDIPLPDVDALVGILRHHLGEDADKVVASADASVASREPNLAAPAVAEAEARRAGQEKEAETTSRAEECPAPREAHASTTPPRRWLRRLARCWTAGRLLIPWAQLPARTKRSTMNMGGEDAQR